MVLGDNTENRNAIILIVAAVILTAVGSYTVLEDDDAPQDILRTDTQPGDYTVVLQEYMGISEEVRVTVVEVGDDGNARFFISSDFGAYYEDGPSDSLYNGLIVDSDSFTDVEEVGRSVESTFLGIKECVAYDAKYDGIPYRLTADAETGLIYVSEFVEDGQPCRMTTLEHSMVSVFGPGPLPVLSDTVKTFDQVVPGDCYQVSQVYPGDSERLMLKKCTVVSVDREAGTLDILTETSWEDTYETVTWDEFIGGVVIDPEGMGLTEVEDGFIKSVWGVRECTVYTHPDGIQEFAVGKDTNVLYTIVSDGDKQILDVCTLFEGVEPGPVPVLGDTVKSASDLEEGDYIEFMDSVVEGDVSYGQSVFLEIVSVDREAGTVTYSTDGEGETTVTGDDFVGLITQVPQEGRYDSVDRKVVDINGEPRLCDVYFSGFTEYMTVGSESGVSYIVNTFDGEVQTGQRLLSETSLLV